MSPSKRCTRVKDRIRTSFLERQNASSRLKPDRCFAASVQARRPIRSRIFSVPTSLSLGEWSPAYWKVSKGFERP
jgi:hypothetical protein